MIITSTVLTDLTCDGRTDGLTYGHIYAVAR